MAECRKTKKFLKELEKLLDVKEELKNILGKQKPI